MPLANCGEEMRCSFIAPQVYRTHAILARVSAIAGFELQGADGDETRLLVHLQLGYSIAVPGTPRITKPKAELPRYDVLLALGDAPVELGFRMDEIPGSMAAPAVATSSLSSYAITRSQNPAQLRPAALDGRLLARAASSGLYAMYQVRGDDQAAMEFLVVTAKAARSATHALHMTVRFRRGDFTPFAWSNMRPALLAHQSWSPTELPSQQIWPETGVFLVRSVKFELTDEAFETARAKAASIGDIAAADVDQLADILLEATNIDDAPSAAWGGDAELALARRIAGCVPTAVAEVLMGNMPLVRTAHDLRGWLWQCYWALGNRAGLRKT